MPAAGGAAPDPGYAAAPAPAAASGMADNLAGALCYLLGVITGILFLVLEPYNRSKIIRFHAFQSIFFGIATLVVWVVVMVISAVLSAIPVIGWIVSLLLSLGLAVGVLITWLMLMWKTYNNQKMVLPVVGPLAEKQA